MATPQHQELAAIYDSEIDAHFAEILRLRKKRNADCSATRKLPPEILAQIFGIVVYSARGVSDYPLSWVAITYVCSSWRNVALDEPSLWTDFTNVHLKWVREVFARSKAATLRVRVGGYSMDSRRRFRFLIEDMNAAPERLKALEVESNSSFLALLNKPTPFLEALTVNAAEVTFPSDFLGGCAPRLHYVKSCASLPADASWLANLTSLECQGMLCLEATWFSHVTSLQLGVGWDGTDASTGKARPVSMDVLLTMLENMPLLERLSLSPPNNFDPAPSTRSTPVDLHHLHDITAWFGGEPNLAKIFNHLRADDIHRICTYWPHSSTKTTTFIKYVCHFFETCYHGINPSMVQRTDAGLEIYKVLNSTGASTPVLSLKNFDPSDLQRFMKLLPRCVPRTYSIRRSYYEYIPAQALGLTDCNTIEELLLTNRLLVSCFLALPADDVNAIPYPSLRLIRIEGLDFTSKPQLTSHLKRWLERRAVVSKIDNLAFEDCKLSDEDIESLREVVHVSSC
ncbi:hypothetical protein PC9H_009936 [Pleurotus ostreatus]|uniref:F-box domain-containing protein n=1 Tax=Pleurotus ostreatus TaxID=5322 RepID=A0A8H6ZMV0_PLEOS|nr:uncharacterized protein PC9H_009936 [Pleurotus ostreatus]KAF7424628.1 hypothetical protein PC9H_009936 [Pleurotus ostreatus]KAJ8692398.1 hypothetical protein PTI98_009714 [Pleurotus ostreatus]